MRTLLTALLAMVLGLAGCRNSDGTAPLAPCEVGQVCIAATVKLVPVEGGCWAVRGDNGVQYEPVTLPENARVDGRRVYMVAVVNKNRGSFCMVGTIVDVVSIRALP